MDKQSKDEADELLLKKQNPKIVQINGGKQIGTRLANLNGNTDYNKVMNRRSVNEKALKTGVVMDGATAMWWNDDGKQKSIGEALIFALYSNQKPFCRYTRETSSNWILWRPSFLGLSTCRVRNVSFYFE